MKHYYTNPKSNKEIRASECTQYICPIKRGRNGGISLCDGPDCMAWKWTGFTQEQVYMGIKNDPGSEFTFATQEQEKRTFTHGCCGLVYREEIKPNEII